MDKLVLGFLLSLTFGEVGIALMVWYFFRMRKFPSAEAQVDFKYILVLLLLYAYLFTPFPRGSGRWCKVFMFLWVWLGRFSLPGDCLGRVKLGMFCKLRWVSKK